MNPVRLIIVDDHAIVREGLRTLLSDEPGIDIVGEAASGQEAVDMAVAKRPDVVLLDLILPDFDGIAATRHLKEAGFGGHVIILTSSFENLRVQEAIRAGALGYLLKDVEKPQLLQAIRDASGGRPTLHPEAQAQLVYEAAAAPPPHEDLTARELDVLRLIGQGCGNRQIADRLFLTEGTVKGYTSIIFDKLGVSDRTQAALYAVKHGLVDGQ